MRVRLRRLPKLLLLAGLLLLPLAASQPARAQGFTAEQRAEIVRILREAMVADPSILRDAIASLQEEETRAEAAARSAALAQAGPSLERDPADPSVGPADARVTVVEFFDFRCPYCRQMVPRIEELLRAERDVRVVYKDVPILGPNSVVLSRAALAAHLQGRYEAMHEALFALRGNPDEAALRRAARDARVDFDRMVRDMEGPEVTARIEANLAAARALGVRGTPAYVIGGRIVPGAVPVEQLRAAVAEARSQPR